MMPFVNIRKYAKKNHCIAYSTIKVVTEWPSSDDKISFEDLVPRRITKRVKKILARK